MSLITFITYTYHLDLVSILDCILHYIDYVFGFLIHGLAMSILSVGDESLLEHAKGAYLVFL